MTTNEATAYHVLLEGRSVGPYDRRTIVGMRIKEMLTSDNLLIDNNGVQLTVGDLLAQRVAQNGFDALNSGVFSPVRGTYAASLHSVKGKGYAIPAFKGEIEVRVQADVVRIAGRIRKWLAWKDTRVKIPLAAFVHARVTGSRLDLWLRRGVARPGEHLQRMSLELFSAESADELVELLPLVTAPPAAIAPLPAAASGKNHWVWVAVIGAPAVLIFVALVLVFGRMP